MIFYSVIYSLQKHEQETIAEIMKQDSSCLFKISLNLDQAPLNNANGNSIIIMNLIRLSRICGDSIETLDLQTWVNEIDTVKLIDLLKYNQFPKALLKLILKTESISKLIFSCINIHKLMDFKDIKSTGLLIRIVKLIKEENIPLLISKILLTEILKEVQQLHRLISKDDDDKFNAVAIATDYQQFLSLLIEMIQAPDITECLDSFDVATQVEFIRLLVRIDCKQLISTIYDASSKNNLSIMLYKNNLLEHLPEPVAVNAALAVFGLYDNKPKSDEVHQFLQSLLLNNTNICVAIIKSEPNQPHASFIKKTHQLCMS